MAQAADRGSLIFGGNSDFSPYEFTNERNEPDGYNIDLIKAVARQIGVEIQVELGPFAAARRGLESGRFDGLTGVLYSRERDKVFDFSVPHIVISYAVFVRKDSGIKTPMDLEGKEVVVVKGVYAYDWLTQNDFTPRIVVVDRPEDALIKLSQGHHDCAVLIRLNGLDLMRNLKIDNLKTIGPPVLTQKMGFAVKAGDANLLARINEGLFLVQSSGEYDRIFLKWFSVYEQNRIRERMLALGKWIGMPMIVLLLFVGGWVWSLKRLVAHRTKKLNENQLLLNRIVQGTPLPTLVADRNGEIIFWNQACEELTGIRSIDAVGRRCDKTGSGEEGDAYLLQMIPSPVEEKTAGKRLIQRTTSREHAAGPSKMEVFAPELGAQGAWLSAAIVQFKDEEGFSLGTIETWQDLTERKFLEKKLVQAQRLEAMGRLAGAIAHDFTNYLQAVMVYSETALAEISPDSPVRPHLEGIRETVERAKKLVLQIKVFSRQRWLKPKAIQLKKVVVKAVEAIRATAPKDIRIRLSADSNTWIMGDEIPISQVVTNLCMNACSAMRSGGGTLTVQLSDIPKTPSPGEEEKGIQTEGYVKLTVSDTGHGIPAEQLERIFEPFYTTRRHEGGTGMGLAIIHGIVKGYDGEITVKSREGKGTDFEVIWPEARVEEEVC